MSTKTNQKSTNKTEKQATPVVKSLSTRKEYILQNPEQKMADKLDYHLKSEKLDLKKAKLEIKSDLRDLKGKLRSLLSSGEFSIEKYVELKEEIRATKRGLSYVKEMDELYSDI